MSNFEGFWELPFYKNRQLITHYKELRETFVRASLIHLKQIKTVINKLTTEIN